MVPEKLCSKCRKTKILGEFGLDPKLRLGRQSWCRACYRRRDQERPRTATHRARRKEYNQKPEVVARRREQARQRRQTEKYRRWRNEYNRRPEVVARRRLQRPRDRERERRYRQTPWGKILRSRARTRQRLLRAGDEPTRAELRRLLTQHEDELDRLMRHGKAPARHRRRDPACPTPETHPTGNDARNAED